MSQSKTIFRVSFTYLESVYDLYANHVTESDMFGFLQVEQLSFGENTSLVVDPSEEKLKMEFGGVKRTYIPMHSVIRIDEVSKQGTAKLKEKTDSGNKISQFPVPDSKK